MTYDAVKGKLHNYIEHADQSKVIAIYTLLKNDMGVSEYDDATLDSLEKTRDNMLAGKERTYTLDETIANLQAHRRKNGI